MAIERLATAASEVCEVTFLDMGEERFGDCMVCRFGQTTVLIDGGHPGDYRARFPGHLSIPEQLAKVLSGGPPFRFSLLIVTHAHSDHIGCLPRLVEDGTIEAEWALVCDPDLGWGRLDGAASDETSSEVARRMAAALREESRADEQDSARLEDFITDAASVEPSYRRMLEKLASKETRVVRYARDDHAALQSHFAAIGLQILGPTVEQVRACAAEIARRSRTAHRGTDAFVAAHADAAEDLATLYRVLVAGSADAADAGGEGTAGPCINDQSIVLRFEYLGQALFFSGDMQLHAPQFSGADGSMSALRQVVAAAAPYSLVKFPHHGSWNGIDDEIFDAFQARFFGLCAGSGDLAHPSQQARDILDRRRQAVRWTRTDKNGLSRFRWNGKTWDISVEAGKLNDATENSRADTAAPAPAVAPLVEPPGQLARPQPGAALTPGEPATTGGDLIEVQVHAQVPRRATRVTVSVDMQPEGVATPSPLAVAAAASRRDEPGSQVASTIRLAGGRPIARLLFATSRDALVRNVPTVADAVLAALRTAGHAVCDTLPAGSSIVESARLVTATARQAGVAGVVLLGGYDVVPARALDVLDPGLRAALGEEAANDADNFIVWSDDAYGDLEGDGFPELPVSRIPDGRSTDLLLAALQPACGRIGAKRRGVRNLWRPFADRIWQGVAGTGDLLQSQPINTVQSPEADLQGDQTYVMLHGSASDGSRFWGEAKNHSMVEALNLASVPGKCASVVFTGCCWAALAADTLALEAGQGRPAKPRTPSNSIALRYLLGGVTAFVGCTGSHYSPAPPGGFFGGPMHEAFWRHLNSGCAPASALHCAKQDYAARIPHGQTDRVARAIEKKILWEYTCLGLGW